MVLKLKMTPRRQVFIVCSIMTVLLYLRCISDVFIFPAIAVGLAAMIFFRQKEAFILLLYLLPFSVIYKISPNQISIFTILYLIYIARILFKKTFSKKFIFAIMAFLGYNLVFSGLSSIVTIMTMTFGFVMINNTCKSETPDFLIHIYALSFGMVLAAALGMIGKNWGILSNFIETQGVWVGSDESVGNRFSGLASNPNYFSFDLILMLSCLSVVILKERKSAMAFTIFIVLSIFGFFSVSKTFIIMFVLLLSLLLVGTFNESKEKFFWVLGLFVAAGFFTLLFARDAIQLYAMRFHGIRNQSLSQMTTSRSTIWGGYLHAIIHNLKILLFGSGIHTLLHMGARFRASHNAYLQGLYSFGLVGSFAYMTALKSALVFSEVKEKDIVLWLPVVVLIVNMIAIDALTYDNFLFHVAIICNMINYYRQRRN